MKNMHETVHRLSVIIALPISLIATLFQGWQGFLGIWMGSIIGLWGYKMIVDMTIALSPESDAKVKAITGYLIRYGLYALVMIVGSQWGISVVTILTGFLSHKASLLVYTWLERRNVNGPTN